MQLAKRKHDNVNNKNKRLQHPTFELPPNMISIAKKRSFDQKTKNMDEMEKGKQPRYDYSKENGEKPKELSRTRKRKTPVNQLCNLQTKRKKYDGANYVKPNKRYIIPTKHQFLEIENNYTQKKRKRPMEEKQNTNIRSQKIQNKTSQPYKKVRRKQDMMGSEIIRIYKPINEINKTGKTNHNGKPPRRSWYSYLRHAQQSAR